MTQRHLLVFTFLVSFVLNAYSAIELRSTQMRTSDGLPNNSIRYIYQDSKGFLWLATLNGLSRYDGNSFLTFRPEAGDKVSLADNRIYDLTEDKDGFLWISTTPELYSCYDLQRARFVDYTGCGELRQNYSTVFVTANGDVWLSHQGNGCRRMVHQKNGEMTSTVFRTERGNLPDNRVKFVNEDASGRIWIGTQCGLVSVSNGQYRIEDRLIHFTSSLAYKDDMYFLTADGDIYYYHSATQKMQKLAALSTVAGQTSPTGNFLLKDKWMILTTTGVYTYDFTTGEVAADPRLNIKKGELIRDNHGDYWIYNHTGHLTYVVAATGESKDFQLIPQDKISYIDFERYHIVHDSRGIIWISTYGNGLFAYNTAEDKLEHFVANINDQSHISSDFLQYVMEDRAGGIWVASEYSGLSRISVLNEGTSRIYPESRELFDRSNTIRMLTKMSNGDIWVGTRKGGLYTFDANLQSKMTNQYFHSNIYAIAEDRQGRMWTGTRGNGLKVGDTWYYNTPSDPTSLSDNNVFAIYRDRKDRMWVGTFGGGLELAEPTSDGKYKFRHFFQQTFGMRMVRVIEEDENGMVWVGTSEGICIFHPDSLIADGDNYHLFSYTNGKFCSNEIKCIYRDTKGRMWIGTSGSGLNLCTPQDDYHSLKYEHYGTSEGLVNDVIQSVLGDRKGNLWVATEYGISKFTPSTRSFENYFFSSYTLGNVYSENSACMREDGKLLFGTNYGLIVIDPEKIQDSETFSPVVFTDLYVNGTQMNPQMEDSPLKQSLAYSDEITLKYFQNSFLIDFSTFDYSDSGHTKYMYWLENYDQGWSAPSPLNFASFKYLNPGTYILHVKSSNGSGIWNDSETTLKIVIVPPFWKTTWAMLCYVLLLMVALYFAFRIVRNFNGLRNRINVEKQLTEYKLVFFTNISHEFRTPLTIIRGAIEDLSNQKDLPPAANKQLGLLTKSSNRLLRLIDQLLEFRRLQNNKMELKLEETVAERFFYDIYLTFKDMAAKKRIEYLFESNDSTGRMLLDRSKMDKIAYNLLSNAFKNTPAGGKIVMRLDSSAENDTFTLSVSDSGPGVPAEKRKMLFVRFEQINYASDGTGVGLHLTAELAKVHKGNVAYSDSSLGGACFSLTIPLSDKNYDPADIVQSSASEPDVAVKEITTGATLPDEKAVEILGTSVNKPFKEYKVMVIDDDDDVRTLIESQLGKYFTVSTASNGAEGLEKLAEDQPDIVVCDVMMPEMDGFEFTKRLKNDFNISHIPVILLTAYSSEEHQLKGIQLGADSYITKPFSVQYLLARVVKLIEQREKLQRKFATEPGNLQPLISTTDRDKIFLDKINAIIERNMGDAEFKLDTYAPALGLGRTTFYSKLKSIVGCSPNEYVRLLRMKRAAELLITSDINISEAGYQVGINDPFYFSKCFRNTFGKSPSQYRKSAGKSDTKESAGEE